MTLSISRLLAPFKMIFAFAMVLSLLLPVSAFAWGYGSSDNGYRSSGYNSGYTGYNWGSGYGGYNYSYANNYRSTPTYNSTPSSGYTCANQSSQFQCDYTYNYSISYYGNQMTAMPANSYNGGSYGWYGGNNSYSRGYNRGW